MGTHLWFEINAELQNMFDTKVFVKKYKKELLQKYYWWIMASWGACTRTHPPYDYIMTLHLEKESSKLVILLNICPKGLSGLGRFDSISYFLASIVMALVTCLLFQRHSSLFHCLALYDIYRNRHTYIYIQIYEQLHTGTSPKIAMEIIPHVS